MVTELFWAKELISNFSCDKLGTDFQFFLRQMAIGNIYYDPGIKLEYASSHPKIKKRSQFRIKSQYLENLYNHSEIVTLPYNS